MGDSHKIVGDFQRKRELFYYRAGVQLSGKILRLLLFLFLMSQSAAGIVYLAIYFVIGE